MYETSISHRAIGVVYNPDRESWGNYVPSAMSKRYDAFIYLDKTKALHPLNLHPNNERLPETYPFGY
jgi:erythromycin esterase-like protein